jgi:adenosylcobinamide-GDP ribazoletransferase
MKVGIELSFFAVLRFLTVLPVPSSGRDDTSTVGRSLALFPMAGLIIGLVLAVLAWTLSIVFPLQVVSALLVVALAVMTGAHHLDGLIDTCDAMVAGRTREQRLEIMSDTRVGAFGIAGVCLLLITKYAAILATSALAAIIVFPILSRWALTASIIIFPSAKNQGSGHAVKAASGWSSLLLGTAITVIMLIFCLGLIEAVVVMATLLALICLLALLLTRLYGGLTGDCYGALTEIGEVAALLVIMLQIPLRHYIPGYNMLQLPFLRG